MGGHRDQSDVRAQTFDRGAAEALPGFSNLRCKSASFFEHGDSPGHDLSIAMKEEASRRKLVRLDPGS